MTQVIVIDLLDLFTRSVGENFCLTRNGPVEIIVTPAAAEQIKQDIDKWLASRLEKNHAE
jgi:hypothetical protein